MAKNAHKSIPTRAEAEGWESRSQMRTVLSKMKASGPLAPSSREADQACLPFFFSPRFVICHASTHWADQTPISTGRWTRQLGIYTTMAACLCDVSATEFHLPKKKKKKKENIALVSSPPLLAHRSCPT